jgi:hypothetical protein
MAIVLLQIALLKALAPSLLHEFEEQLRKSRQPFLNAVLRSAPQELSLALS